MRIENISTEFFYYDVPNAETHKNNLLELINLIPNNPYEGISHTDWNLPKQFERKYLDYFMTTTCCYGPWSYFKIVFDKRGHDSPIGWLIEHYLNLKNINWKGELIDK